MKVLSTSVILIWLYFFSFSYKALVVSYVNFLPLTVLIKLPDKVLNTFFFYERERDRDRYFWQGFTALIYSCPALHLVRIIGMYPDCLGCPWTKLDPPMQLIIFPSNDTISVTLQLGLRYIFNLCSNCYILLISKIDT